MRRRQVPGRQDGSDDGQRMAPDREVRVFCRARVGTVCLLGTRDEFSHDRSRGCQGRTTRVPPARAATGLCLRPPSDHGGRWRLLRRPAILHVVPPDVRFPDRRLSVPVRPTVAAWLAIHVNPTSAVSAGLNVLSGFALLRRLGESTTPAGLGSPEPITAEGAMIDGSQPPSPR